jgi:hypothetical protein
MMTNQKIEGLLKWAAKTIQNNCQCNCDEAHQSLTFFGTSALVGSDFRF